MINYSKNHKDVDQSKTSIITYKHWSSAVLNTD